MDELSHKARIAIARRIREYALFLRNYTSYTEMDEYNWDFPVICTPHEIKVQLEDIIEETLGGFD